MQNPAKNDLKSNPAAKSRRIKEFCFKKDLNVLVVEGKLQKITSHKVKESQRNMTKTHGLNFFKVV